MKRAIPAILLTVFSFNIIGYYAVFCVLNMENRGSVEQLLEDRTALQTLRIPKALLKNVVFHTRASGNEISFNGEMYDVKSMANDGDFVVFQCINDKTENKLLAGLDTQVENNTDSKSPDKKQDNSPKNPVKSIFLP